MPRLKLTDVLTITLIALLSTAAFLPAAEKLNEESKRKICANNLTIIGKAFLLYSNENKGSFPRTRAKTEMKENTYHFFTNPNIAKVEDKPADTDPFGDKGPDTNDITGAIYLLLRTQDLTAEVFLCPAVSGEIALPRRDGKSQQLPGEPALDFAKQTNFASPKYLDFSFVNMYPTSHAISLGYKTFITAFGSDFAIAADMNPGAKELTKLTPQSPAADFKASNSANHDGAGQNVLYADCSVQWQKTPLCGAERTKGKKTYDNIYTHGVPSDTSGGDGVVGAPADAVDSVLLPSAVECLAAMPKAAK